MSNNYLKYSILTILLLVFSLSVNAEETAKEVKKDTIFRGVSAHIDIASPVMGYVTDKSIRTLEGSFDVNLLHRFFPIVEFGFGTINRQLENGASYRANAPFLRMGMNFNLLNQRKNKRDRSTEHYAFLGLRYGMSFVNFSMENMPITDNYWQQNALRSYAKNRAYAGWAELVAGIRVDLVKGFTMGWSIRYKMLLHSNLSNKKEMWFVPGFGKSNESVFDFNYTIGYTFNKDKKTIKPTEN